MNKEQSMDSKVVICPSMLSADSTQLGQQLLAVESAGADRIHWDIMDGNYVEAITFGSHVVAAHRKLTSLPFDVHLMVDDPDRHIDNFASAGADLLIVHPETCKHLHRTLQKIKNLGKEVGVALNPSTPIEVISYCIEMLDVVLVMTVNPGSSGQKFIDSQLKKISVLRKILLPKTEICVDGGINPSTLKKCLENGANNCVTGAFLFNSNSYADAINTLKSTTKLSTT
ncbi:MAG: ribulose-phosphate 3-epimerase [Holosporaceae bacterium]|jgi:ribulose-phosphate 3-epimerase|nr:ribulose-phosphate 3-epimerase [Holosporaceae bacterium]